MIIMSRSVLSTRSPILSSASSIVDPRFVSLSKIASSSANGDSNCLAASSTPCWNAKPALNEEASIGKNSTSCFSIAARRRRWSR